MGSEGREEPRVSLGGRPSVYAASTFVPATPLRVSDTPFGGSAASAAVSFDRHCRFSLGQLVDMNQERLILLTALTFEYPGRHQAGILLSDPLRRDPGTAATGGLAACSAGTLRIADRSRLSRRFIRVRKAERMRLFNSSVGDFWPTATSDSFIEVTLI